MSLKTFGWAPEWDREWEHATLGSPEERGVGIPATLELALTSKLVHSFIGTNTCLGGELWIQLSMMMQ